MPFKNGVLQKDKYRHRDICPGIAASMGLRCSGRRNAPGSIVGRRLCQYFSATSAILAKIIKSNTNVQTPYRLPLLECTHDQSCQSKKCLSPQVMLLSRSFGNTPLRFMPLPYVSYDNLASIPFGCLRTKFIVRGYPTALLFFLFLFHFLLNFLRILWRN